MDRMIEYYRKTKEVRRMQGTFLHRSYNLAEHQYQVAMLFRHFAILEEIDYSLEVLEMVLHHDILEVETTDLLWPIKNLNSKTQEAWELIEEEVVKENFQLKPYTDVNINKSMNEEQFRMFKCCDYLDLWIFMVEEIRLGNKHPEILKTKENCEVLILAKYDFEHVKIFMNEYGK